MDDVPGTDWWASVIYVPPVRYGGSMTAPVVAGLPSSHLKIDSKRRAVLSPAVLAAAELAPGADLVARVEGPGRIVLESLDTVLARVQEAVRCGKAAAAREAFLAGEEPPAEFLADELMAERARDTSLEGYRPSDS